MSAPVLVQHMTITPGSIKLEDGGMAAIVDDPNETFGDPQAFVRLQSWDTNEARDRSIDRHKLIASLVGKRVRIEVHVEGDA